MRLWSVHPLPECADMTKYRILYLIALAGSFVFYLAYQKWFSWIVLLAVLFLPWFSLLVSLPAMCSIKLSMTAPHRVTQGEKVIIHPEAECTGPMPPVECRIRVTKPNTGEVWTLRSGDTLPSEHCGGLHLQMEKVQVIDFMCLMARRIRKGPSCTVRLMPRPLEVQIPPEISRYLSGSWRPKKGGGYAENHEIRPWKPGDTMNLVHWKLSAKVDSLMLREPVEPDLKLLLTMDLSGTPEELDRKFGRLMWLGNRLLEEQVSFTVLAMTGNGMESWQISAPWALTECMDDLLCAPCTPEGSVEDRQYTGVLRYCIGGEPDAE